MVVVANKSLFDRFRRGLQLWSQASDVHSFTLAARQLWPLTRGVALDWPTVGSTHLRISESTDTA